MPKRKHDILPEVALTFNTLNSLSNILRRGTVSGEKKFPNFAKNTPFLKASSNSVVAGNSSFRHASIHLDKGQRVVITIYKWVMYSTEMLDVPPIHTTLTLHRWGGKGSLSRTNLNLAYTFASSK